MTETKEKSMRAIKKKKLRETRCQTSNDKLGTFRNIKGNHFSSYLFPYRFFFIYVLKRQIWFVFIIKKDLRFITTAQYLPYYFFISITTVIIITIIYAINTAFAITVITYMRIVMALINSIVTFSLLGNIILIPIITTSAPKTHSWRQVLP